MLCLIGYRKNFILIFLIDTLNIEIHKSDLFIREDSDFYMPNWSGLDKDTFFYIKLGLSILVFLLCLMFFGPLLYLLYVQTTNLLLNKTTSERYSTNNRNESRSNVDKINKKEFKQIFHI